MDLLADLVLAKQTLDDAFAWARTVDYRAGSLQMQRLAAAEHGYQQARQQYEQAARPARHDAPEHPSINLREDPVPHDRDTESLTGPRRSGAPAPPASGCT